jgi:hypothetical protein
LLLRFSLRIPLKLKRRVKKRREEKKRGIEEFEEQQNLIHSYMRPSLSVGSLERLSGVVAELCSFRGCLMF